MTSLFSLRISRIPRSHIPNKKSLPRGRLSITFQKFQTYFFFLAAFFLGAAFFFAAFFFVAILIEFNVSKKWVNDSKSNNYFTLTKFFIHKIDNGEICLCFGWCHRNICSVVSSFAKFNYTIT